MNESGLTFASHGGGSIEPAHALFGPLGQSLSGENAKQKAPTAFVGAFA